MKKILAALVLSFMLAELYALCAFAQDLSAGVNNAQPPAPNMQQDPYRQQIRSLMEEFKSAKTIEERKIVHDKLTQAREQYRASHPVKELTPVEIKARQQKMEDSLKKDPFRWQIYQLKQSMASAKTQEERESISVRMKYLQAEHAAEEEAKLTPAQRAERQDRQVKKVQMGAELKPIQEQLRGAKTKEERKAIHTQMREILKKYR